MSLNITPLRIEDAESNHNNSTNTYPERFILNDNWSKTNILDIIPSKYERKSKSLYLKYLTYLIIVIIILIFFGTFQLINQKFNTYLEIINFIFIVIFLILNVSWLYYKLQQWGNDVVKYMTPKYHPFFLYEAILRSKELLLELKMYFEN